MLNIQSLSKTYADGTRALAGIDLQVPNAEIVALIGGSGCGKTTLLRLIAGLDRPSAGRIALDGEPITAPHPGVGLVFQEPRLLPWLSVADNVGFGIAHRPGRERRERVAHALERVGLAEHADRWPRELSGGQQQRVSIARAFVAQPRVLLLDEPFSALDAFTRKDLHRHLLALWEEVRPTVLIVTHDVAEAVALADRAIVMRPRPGRLDDTIALSMRRPRDPAAATSEAATRTILAALDHSLRPRDASPAPELAGGSSF
ncbi:ABC transporter related [Methylorubrum populi BJ001]|jgi:sulfonate transport system ATP-binding protein|uniref:ABC transporter related n=2 Tax=Methylorubrum TaxID=2282523 RepID=B1ZI97_METPB|nr:MULTISPECIES: ABC transporter ATP-binding protein [Methylorubrum]ACB78586.1 ABC transporter related [Methylorubrum populi BJ001]MBA8915192.1 sulfonate transport system ATP-binding protein [Methylorubrum thiocyanatum]OAH35060.1 nitrate/sulfonate/bicarbonate ABC transporter ATP-binding protein [Methylorubrum populi]PZP69884.1 MAG: ABC transporter ATP-binding protein [Methylorubrum populi]GJE81957.1 Nitrate import ATP-binding protein NrtD [Methylorubrum thiocyanatum]